MKIYPISNPLSGCTLVYEKLPGIDLKCEFHLYEGGEHGCSSKPQYADDVQAKLEAFLRKHQFLCGTEMPATRENGDSHLSGQAHPSPTEMEAAGSRAR